jgi:hypothetical protein
MHYSRFFLQEQKSPHSPRYTPTYFQEKSFMFYINLEFYQSGAYSSTPIYTQ